MPIWISICSPTPSSSASPRRFSPIDSGGVRLVHHEPRAVFFLERDDFAQRRGVAIHRKNGFGDDQNLDSGFWMRTSDSAHFNLSSKSFKSLWAKTRSFAPDNFAASTMQAWTSLSKMITSSLPSSAQIVPMAVGVAGGKGQRGFGAFEIGQRFFQFMKRRERAANQTRRPGPGAKFFNGRDGGFFQDRMIGKAEIIVGRKIQKGFAADLDAWTLRRNPRGAIRGTGFVRGWRPGDALIPSRNHSRCDGPFVRQSCWRKRLTHDAPQRRKCPLFFQ